jgi:hypothetical protein
MLKKIKKLYQEKYMKKFMLSIILLSLTNAQITQPMQSDATITQILVDAMFEYDKYLDTVPLIDSNRYQDMIVNLYHISKFPAIEIDLNKIGFETPESYDSSNLKFDKSSFYVNGSQLAPDSLFNEFFIETYAPAKTHKKLIIAHTRVRSYINSFIEKTLAVITQINKDQIITLINKLPFPLAQLVQEGIVTKLFMFKPEPDSVMHYTEDKNRDGDDATLLIQLNENILLAQDFDLNSVALWDMSNKKENSMHCNVMVKAHSVATEPILKFDEKTFISTSMHDNVIKVWDIDSLKCRISFQNNEKCPFLVKFDKNTLLSFGSNLIKIWNMNTGSLSTTFKTELGLRLLKKFDRNSLVSSSYYKDPNESTINIWDMKSLASKPKASFKTHGRITTILPFQGKLISCSWDNETKKQSLAVWDMISFSPVPIATFEIEIQFINQINKFNDRILILYSDTTMKKWDMKSLQHSDILTNHMKSINSIRKFNDSTLISSSLDQTVKVWDMNTNPPTNVATTCKEECEYFEKFSKNTFALISHKTIKLWHVPDFETALYNYVKLKKMGKA